MEEKQKTLSATGFSGKYLVASLFILSGILLFARNMGWITAELFSTIVSWYSLFIILGIYSMIRRHFVGGIILLLIGVYFLLGGLSWLPENSQAMVWPLALIIAGVLLIFKSRRRGPWSHSHMAHHRKEWMKRRGLGMNFKEEQQQCESVDGFCIRKMFGERHVMSYLMSYSKELLFVLRSGVQLLICVIPILRWEKLISIWTVAGEELRFMFLPIGK